MCVCITSKDRRLSGLCSVWKHANVCGPVTNDPPKVTLRYRYPPKNYFGKSSSHRGVFKYLLYLRILELTVHNNKVFLTTLTALYSCSEVTAWLMEAQCSCSSITDFRPSAVQSATIQPQSRVLKGKPPSRQNKTEMYSTGRTPYMHNNTYSMKPFNKEWWRSDMSLTLFICL